MSAEHAQAIALSDQVWANLAEFYGDIARIQKHGQNGTADDALIVKMVLCAVLGELHLRRAQADGGQDD